MRTVALAALYLAGCGRIAFDALADGGSGDDAVDAAPVGPFGPPVHLSTISGGATEDDPSLTADLLEIYFESSRGGGSGGADVWFSVRANVTDPWPAPSPAPFNTANDDEHPGLSADGLSLYFTSDRTGGAGSSDIWRVTRPTRAAAWTSPIAVTELNTAMNDEAPQPSSDDLALVFGRGPNSSDEDVWIATRATTTAPWSSPPVVVSSVDVNVAGVTDSSPALDASKRVLYFSSSRSGNNAIYTATRNTLTAPFDTVVRLDLGMMQFGESDPWISGDQRTIVFSSGGRLYEATR